MIFSSAQVVGVARDNQIYRSGETLPLIVYLPGAAPGQMDTALLVRTTQDASALKDLARGEAYAIEPVLRLFVKTFEERIAGEQTIMSAASHGATALGILALMGYHRALRRDGLASGPTHTRNRNSHGAWGTGTQCSRSCAEPGHEAGCDWRRHWYSGLTGRGATVIEYVGWIDDKRCAHHWNRYSATGGSDVARLLFTSATRNESRSVGDAQIRVSRSGALPQKSGDSGGGQYHLR